MALWKARGGNRLPGGSRVEGKRTRELDFRSWYCGRQGGKFK